MQAVLKIRARLTLQRQDNGLNVTSLGKMIPTKLPKLVLVKNWSNIGWQLFIIGWKLSRINKNVIFRYFLLNLSIEKPHFTGETVTDVDPFRIQLNKLRIYFRTLFRRYQGEGIIIQWFIILYVQKSLAFFFDSSEGLYSDNIERSTMYCLVDFSARSGYLA